jgi:oligoendopeptidase F
MTWEIAGVALVDIEVWHWMYEHPKATPAQLREATVGISKRIWNQYYAPVLGAKDTALLGIYSHMISYPMYLFNYPLGHLIAFQLEEQVKKTGKIGPEIERMAKYGAVTPDLWMVNATGEPVSAGPLLRATATALGAK